MPVNKGSDAGPVAMPPGLRQFDQAVGKVSLVASVIGATLIALICFLMVADIAGRSIGRPIVGTLEITKLSIVAIAFLTIPYGMRMGAHVRSTIFLGRSSIPIQRWLNIFFAVIAASVFAYIAWTSWEPMLFAIQTGEFEGEGAMRVPIWPARTTILLGSSLMAVECLLSMFRQPEQELTEVTP